MTLNWSKVAILLLILGSGIAIWLHRDLTSSYLTALTLCVGATMLLQGLVNDQSPEGSDRHPHHKVRLRADMSIRWCFGRTWVALTSPAQRRTLEDLSVGGAFLTFLGTLIALVVEFNTMILGAG